MEVLEVSTLRWPRRRLLLGLAVVAVGLWLARTTKPVPAPVVHSPTAITAEQAAPRTQGDPEPGFRP